MGIEGDNDNDDIIDLESNLIASGKVVVDAATTREIDTIREGKLRVSSSRKNTPPGINPGKGVVAVHENEGCSSNKRGVVVDVGLVCARDLIQCGDLNDKTIGQGRGGGIDAVPAASTGEDLDNNSDDLKVMQQHLPAMGIAMVMDPSIVKRFCSDDTWSQEEDDDDCHEQEDEESTLRNDDNNHVEPTSLRRRSGPREPPDPSNPGAFALGLSGQATTEEVGGADDDEDRAGIAQPQQQTYEPVAPGGDLAVANLVVDDDPVLTQAVEWEMDRSTKEQSQSKKTRMGAVVAATFCFLVVVVIAILVVTNVLATQDNNNEEDVADSTASQFIGKMPMEEYIQSLLPDYSLRALVHPHSPQSLAYDWILEDPALADYPSWRIQQRYALAVLFYSTDGPRWRKSDNWLSWDHHECDWHRRLVPWSLVRRYLDSPLLKPYWDIGICTEDGKGVYQQISLYINDLQGTMPRQLSMLSSLISIMMNSNVLTGTMPSELGQLTHLQVLTLSGNQLQGSFPSQLGLLTSLVAIGTFYNPIGGSIPSELGLWESVVGINMGSNALTGTIPTELANLPMVERIRFDNNQLTGTIPKQLGLRLTGLQILRLDGNELTGSIPSQLFGDCGGQQLTHLSLNHNQLEGSIPSQIGALADSLSYLDISDNELLSGKIPTNFCDDGSSTSDQLRQLIFNCTESLCGCDCPCGN